jgi:uncharacterized membrane protein YagU involved in acid resistance
MNEQTMNASWRTVASVSLQFILYSLVAAGVYYVLSDTVWRSAISLGVAAGLTMTLVIYWLDWRE